MKARIALLMAVAMLAAWMIGYTQAWNAQEIRRLECGAGWYATLELVDTLMDNIQ